MEYIEKKKLENLAKGQVFTLYFSKIRAFGALHPLVACGFERYKNEGILFYKKDTACGYPMQ